MDINVSKMAIASSISPISPKTASGTKSNGLNVYIIAPRMYPSTDRLESSIAPLVLITY